MTELAEQVNQEPANQEPANQANAEQSNAEPSNQGNAEPASPYAGLGLSATYSPEDNKLRLYAVARLPRELYDRVRLYGFIWAPKQELFVAPAWTPDREDFLTRLCGRRAAGALRHAKYKELPAVRYRRIKGLESDQRKQEKYKSEAEKFISLWTAPDKELTRERARAIANYDHVSKSFTLAEFPRNMPASQYEGSMSLWSALGDTPEQAIITPEQAKEIALRVHRCTIEHCDRWLAHLANRLAYERAMLGEAGGTAADKFHLALGGQVLYRGEWSTILRVNKKDGAVCSVRTNAARWHSLIGVEDIQDYKPPTEEANLAARAAAKLPPLCNYPGEGFAHITKAQWEAKHKDYKGSRLVQTATTGAHRVRSGFFSKEGGCCSVLVYVTDLPRKDPPKPAPTTPAESEAPSLPAPETDLATLERRAEAAKARQEASQEDESTGAKFDALKDSLKAGVKVVVADNLFPTPPALAERMAGMLGDISYPRSILEPSAGTGNLVRAVLRRNDCASIHAVEASPAIAEQLRSRYGKGNYNTTITTGDFLSMAPTAESLGVFDCIIMNPPFDHGSDIEHISHALSFLKPGGVLVALCANGPKQRETFQPMASYWEDLDAGTFEGTNVRAALFTIER